MEKSGQYKGIFYKNKVTHRYYEGGAHFSYFALFKRLKELKQDLNNEKISLFSPNSTSSSREKEKEKEEEEYKKIIDLKKFYIPLLSRQKNQSMANIFNDSNKKIKGNDIYSKIINDEFYKTKNIQMKFLQKVKDAENEKYIKKMPKINKYFNESIYNVKNQVNMPLIYNQKNKRENKNFKNKESSYSNELKENKNLGIQNGKMDKMNSTIGFKENNKYLKYYLMNNYDSIQNISSYKNLNLSGFNSKNRKKINNITPVNKFAFINNLKNKNLKISKNKIHNSNSFDFNIKANNLVKIGDNFLNNTKFAFNSNKHIKNKLISNDSKNKDKYNMNISIFNFAKLKRVKKFQINKSIK